MTIKEIYENAERQLEHNEITLGEFEKIVNKEVPDWIPVDKDLPKHDSLVLVSGKRGGKAVTRFFTNGKLHLWKIAGTTRYVNPVAWMPLPEDYKGE